MAVDSFQPLHAEPTFRTADLRLERTGVLLLQHKDRGNEEKDKDSLSCSVTQEKKEPFSGKTIFSGAATKTNGKRVPLNN